MYDDLIAHGFRLCPKNLELKQEISYFLVLILVSSHIIVASLVEELKEFDCRSHESKKLKIGEQADIGN